MANNADTAVAATQPLLPLFYNALQPLSSVVHAGWRLKAGDVSFASESPFVPIVAGELGAAARSYPVVFAGEGAQPVAVLGLERVNLFVEEGRWSGDDYQPAYVRRYPFAYVQMGAADGFVLAIDAGSDRVMKEGGEGSALFENGEPSALTNQALAFCDAFQSEAAATGAFAAALLEQELLIERRADATLPDGRKLGLDGFRIVDAGKFRALPDAVVVEWHKQGWLALVHFHLASLERFAVLLNRQAARTAFTKTSPQDAPAPASPPVAVADDGAPAKAGKTKKAVS